MLPFTKTFSIEEALDAPLFSSPMRFYLTDITWDAFFDFLVSKGLEAHYRQYDELAGDRYLTKVTWDTENFIVTIYDARSDSKA